MANTRFSNYPSGTEKDNDTKNINQAGSKDAIPGSKQGPFGYQKMG